MSLISFYFFIDFTVEFLGPSGYLPDQRLHLAFQIVVGVQHVIFPLPGAAVDGTGNFQFIDDPNQKEIVLDVVEIDGSATEGTTVDVLGVFVVLGIAEVLQAGLAEGVSGQRGTYPQKSRRGLQQTQRQIGHLRRGDMEDFMKFRGSLSDGIVCTICEFRSQDRLIDYYIQNQDFIFVPSLHKIGCFPLLTQNTQTSHLPFPSSLFPFILQQQKSRISQCPPFHSQLRSILLLFSNSPVSFLQKLNSCSSSLLSLSSSASFLDSYRMHYLRVANGPIFLKHILRIQRVSLNLLDSLLVRSSTTINLRPLALYSVARHGPAVAVTPVFTPQNPGLRSNLLVFSQTTSRFTPQFSVQHRNCLQLITSRKTANSRHFPMSMLTSSAVLPFCGWGRPCGLAKTEFLMPIQAARRFMQLMKPRSPSPKRQLPHLARANAASLPLGSISAQKSCVTVQRSPSYNYADVPVISATFASIWTNYLSGFSAICRQMRMAVQNVMILVKLAISTTFLEQQPVTI